MVLTLASSCQQVTINVTAVDTYHTEVTLLLRNSQSSHNYNHLSEHVGDEKG